jgi:hypothetical protein
MCHESRKLEAVIFILPLWLGLSSSARADSSQADHVARLRQKVEAQQSEVRALRERLAKATHDISRGAWRYPASPRNPAPAIEITDVETWWDSDHRPPFGLAPTFRFHLHNIGSKPITKFHLSCTYYLASGTKFGSGGDSLVPNNRVQIIPPGYWMTVQFDWREYSLEGGAEPPVLRPMTVYAEIVLSTDENTRNIVRRITIPPTPQRRIPSEASSS